MVIIKRIAGVYVGMEARQIPIREQKSEKTGRLVGNTSLGYIISKRLIDIIGSVFALVIFSPIFLLTATAIKLDDPKSKVFYSQKRTGQLGWSFDFWKFRSMVPNADALKDKLKKQNEMNGPVFKIANDPRVTRVGRVIRRTSIDELPQFWNVLKGDMSFVGPRPLPVAEEMACDSYQRQREAVKPGITCYWQIRGRNKIDFDGWVELDLQYIREQSLLTDLKILCKTPMAVIKRDGAS